MRLSLALRLGAALALLLLMPSSFNAFRVPAEALVLPHSTDVRSPDVQSTDARSAGDGPAIYAYYYLWWSEDHWHDKLGPNYPYDRNPLPLPATLQPGGCNARSRYKDNQLFDVPQERLWTQDDPQLIERDVRLAADAGLAGFVANWHGTGKVDQTTDDISYSERLDSLIDAVNKVNDEGTVFKLWLNYAASASHRTSRGMINDLNYIDEEYGSEDVWDHAYSERIPLLWGGSRKYSLTRLETIDQRFRAIYYIVGDEDADSWNAERAKHLDGDHYYWSSQNPYSNPHSFGQLQELADEVRSSGSNPDGSSKLWFSPLAAGYNAELLRGGSCVPRRGGETLKQLFDGNSQSDPAGWIFISWNEIAEGTYIRPLKRWGRFYLNALSDLAQP